MKRATFISAALAAGAVGAVAPPVLASAPAESASVAEPIVYSGALRMFELGGGGTSVVATSISHARKLLWSEYRPGTLGSFDPDTIGLREMPPDELMVMMFGENFDPDVWSDDAVACTCTPDQLARWDGCGCEASEGAVERCAADWVSDYLAKPQIIYEYDG